MFALTCEYTDTISVIPLGMTSWKIILILLETFSFPLWLDLLSGPQCTGLYHSCWILVLPEREWFAALPWRSKGGQPRYIMIVFSQTAHYIACQLSVHLHRHAVATGRTLTIVCVCTSFPDGVKVEDEVFRICNSMRCAKKDEIWFELLDLLTDSQTGVVNLPRFPLRCRVGGVKMPRIKRNSSMWHDKVSNNLSVHVRKLNNKHKKQQPSHMCHFKSADCFHCQNTLPLCDYFRCAVRQASVVFLLDLPYRPRKIFVLNQKSQSEDNFSMKWQRQI